MAQVQADRQPLLRKQFLVTQSNVDKLNMIAEANDTSATEVVRQAIEAYRPEDTEMGQSDLMELVAETLKSAIKDTHDTRKRMEKVIKEITVRE